MRDNKLQRRILICTIARTEDFWWLLMVGGLLWGCSPFVWAFFFGFFNFFWQGVSTIRLRLLVCGCCYGFFGLRLIFRLWVCDCYMTFGLRLLYRLLVCGCCFGLDLWLLFRLLVCGCLSSYSVIAVSTSDLWPLFVASGLRLLYRLMACCCCLGYSLQ